MIQNRLGLQKLNELNIIANALVLAQLPIATQSLTISSIESVLAYEKSYSELCFLLPNIITRELFSELLKYYNVHYILDYVKMFGILPEYDSSQ